MATDDLPNSTSPTAEQQRSLDLLATLEERLEGRRDRTSNELRRRIKTQRAAILNPPTPPRLRVRIPASASHAERLARIAHACLRAQQRDEPDDEPDPTPPPSRAARSPALNQPNTRPQEQQQHLRT